MTKTFRRYTSCKMLDRTVGQATHLYVFRKVAGLSGGLRCVLGAVSRQLPLGQIAAHVGLVVGRALASVRMPRRQRYVSASEAADDK